MAHQVLVGVTEDVVPVGAVLREVERLVLEDGDQVGQPLDLFFAVAEFFAAVEVWKIGQLIGGGQRRDDLRVDLVANVGRALQSDQIFEAGARWDSDGGVALTGVLVADVLHEQQEQHIVLVLTGVHAAAKLVPAGPKGGVELGFLDRHVGVGKKCLLRQAEGRLEVSSSTKVISSPGWHPKYRQSLSMISVPMFAPG